MWMPTAFSPNNDDLNDKVVIKPSGPVAFESLNIYNRWGEKVFTSNDINKLWDGMYNGAACEMGVYYYVLRYQCPLVKNLTTRKGDITLIR